MKEGEVLLLELPLPHDRHGQSIAHGQGGSRTGGGSQPKGTCLPFHAHIDDHLAVLGQSGVQAAGESDDLGSDFCRLGEGL